jgi:hypothetical protein
MLIRLAATNTNIGVVFHGGNSNYYPNAVEVRAILTGDRNWTIVDGGLIPYPVYGLNVIPDPIKGYKPLKVKFYAEIVEVE